MEEEGCKPSQLFTTQGVDGEGANELWGSNKRDSAIMAGSPAT